MTLDKLVAALADARPVLDDVARVRVAQRIDAELAAPSPAASRRWVPWAMGVAAVAALVLVLATRGSAHDAELADGTLLVASPDTSVHGELDGSVVTLYGPGWARRSGDALVVDAQALVVDRTRGESPLRIDYRAVSIRVFRATFAADGQRPTRVSVMRGELELTCDGAARTVTAGTSATCGAPVITAAKDAAPTAIDVQPPGASQVDATHGRAPTADSPTSALNVRASGDVDSAQPSPSNVRASSSPDSAKPSASSVRASGAPDSAQPSASNVRASGSPDSAKSSASNVRASGSPDSADVRASAPDAAAPAADSPKPDTVAPTAPADAAARYAAAERLMRSDRAGARRALQALVDELWTAPEAAPALLDLARLALADGDAAAALRSLDRLATRADAATLAMPAAYQRCLVELHRDRNARTCLVRFRAAFPDSIHDADALARLAAGTAATGDCATARPLLDEYARRYPHTSNAAALASWRTRCR